MESANLRADDVFCTALELASAERAAYLDKACGDDLELRRRVERLLNAHAQAGSFLAARPEVAAPTCDAATETPGTVIGPYKLLEQIGEGGMGTVWMAQQTAPVKRVVALKLIKAGMDSKQVIVRFEAERQALALMDHPNIAKVLDGGTTSAGRPYFVMDLVKGVPITRYCDEHHLTPRQRLELFIPICQAVQHAHQKGIIHRDLKPSNVLIALYDGKPVPKVIDFGVAKAAGQSLTEKTLVTGFGNIVGTLEYMSPEQAEINQLDIDTRSDIYSLGVLLYELLTGSPPFSRKELEKAGMLEMLRVIREQEPSKPSTKLSTAQGLPTLAANRGTEPAKLTKLVRGELDWIVMKALEKDRNRRYETANGFSMDVQRYLADEPVLACPPSVGYRLRKFVRRNRGRLAAAAVLAVALLTIVGAAAGSIGWVVRERAERQSRLTGQVELILDDVARREQQQKWVEALAAVDRAEAVLAGGEAGEAAHQRVREARHDLAFIAELDRIRQERAASVDGKFNHAGAARDYVLAFREYGVDVEALPAAEAVARLQRRPALIAPIVAALDDWAHARFSLYEADSGWKLLVAVARGLDTDPLRNRLRALWGQPVTRDLQAELRRLAESMDVKAQSPQTVLLMVISLRSANLANASLRIARAGQFAHPADFWLNLELAMQYFTRKEYGHCQLYSSVAVSLRPDSADARNDLGIALKYQGKFEEAIASFQKAIELDPKHAPTHNNLGTVYEQQDKLDLAAACLQKAVELDPKGSKAWNNLGIVYTRQKKLDEMVASFKKAIELSPKDTIVLHNLGLGYYKLNKWDDAIACFGKCLEIDPKFAKAHYDLGCVLRDRRKLDEAITSFRNAVEIEPTLVDAQVNLGMALRKQGKLDEAITCFEKAIELDPKHAIANMNRGVVLLDQKNPKAAVPWFEKAIDLAPENMDALNGLGYALIELGQSDKAIPHLQKAIELAPKYWSAHNNLGRAYSRLEKRDEAIRCFRTAIELDPTSVLAHMNLGIELGKQKRPDEAAASFKTAIELNPKFAPAHHYLGIALRDQGRLDDAIAEYREALRLDPMDLRARTWLLDTLAPLGRLEELRATWEKALAGNPPEHEAWSGYAELCLYLNNEDAYRRNRTALLKQFGNTTDPPTAERTARACLLLPASGAELDQAVALADRAVELGKDHKYFRFFAVAKALAEYRQDRFESALDWCAKPVVRGTWPALLVLALAHQRLGHTEQARQFFDEAVKTYDWKKINKEWGGILHSLRREAEAVLKIESGVKEPTPEKRQK